MDRGAMATCDTSSWGGDKCAENPPKAVRDRGQNRTMLQLRGKPAAVPTAERRLDGGLCGSLRLVRAVQVSWQLVLAVELESVPLDDSIEGGGVLAGLPLLPSIGAVEAAADLAVRG